jgi:hypothetical protein
MLKSWHKLAVLIDKMQHVANVYLSQRIKKGMVYGLKDTGILQGPAVTFAQFFKLKVLIFTGDKTLIEGFL